MNATTSDGASGQATEPPSPPLPVVLGALRLPASRPVPACPFPCSICREKGRQ